MRRSWLLKERLTRQQQHRKYICQRITLMYKSGWNSKRRSHMRTASQCVIGVTLVLSHCVFHTKQHCDILAPCNVHCTYYCVFNALVWLSCLVQLGGIHRIGNRQQLQQRKDCALLTVKAVATSLQCPHCAYGIEGRGR